MAVGIDVVMWGVTSLRKIEEGIAVLTAVGIGANMLIVRIWLRATLGCVCHMEEANGAWSQGAISWRWEGTAGASLMVGADNASMRNAPSPLSEETSCV
mmetsp:Transcript_13407/g.25749  ORF Transcript_13407/g.25749 Transcript_13407/m.25749 type:complete len:99 (-) Transcript_13407:1563-1859(-)